MSAFANALTEYQAASAAFSSSPRTESEDVVCKRHSRAIDTLLLMPAGDLHELRAKIEVYDREQIEDLWHCSRDITALLASDAARLLPAHI